MIPHLVPLVDDMPEEKKRIKEEQPKQPDATSPTEALSDAMKPTELDNKPKKSNDTR